MNMFSMIHNKEAFCTHLQQVTIDVFISIKTIVLLRDILNVLAKLFLKPPASDLLCVCVNGLK